jgi:transcriptional regulator with XRE-family HTH domain
MSAQSPIQHPLDTELRARLRALDLKQSELAKRIGRKPAWLNKYIRGLGHATIDDAIRIVSVLIGTGAQLTEREQRLLRGFRRLKDDAPQLDVLRHLERVVLPRTRSSGRGGQTRRGATRKGPG